MITRVFVLLVAATVVTSAQAQSPLRLPAATKSASTNQTESQPPVQVVVTLPEPSPQAAAKEDEYREREVVAAEDVRDFTKWLTVLTFVQAILGLLGFGIAIRAANAARQSAEVASAALTKIQRPFVVVNEFVMGATYTETIQAGKPQDIVYRIQPTLRNAGPTPTVNMTLRIGTMLRADLVPNGFSFTYDSKPEQVVIGPQGSMFTPTIVISSDDLVAVRNGTRQFYFWGEGIYRDSFDNTPDHHLRFCYRIRNVIGDPTDPKNGSVTYELFMHSEYNSSD